MVELIACLSTGKGTWQHVTALIKGREWDKVILIVNDFAKENFKAEGKIELIHFNSEQHLEPMTQEIAVKLKDKIKGTEVALNLISGSGKEHMAVLSALLKLGLGIRLVALTKEGVKEV